MTWPVSAWSRSRPRRPGRPKTAEPGSSVSTWLKPNEHDALIRLARQREVSVSAVARALIIRNIPTK